MRMPVDNMSTSCRRAAPRFGAVVVVALLLAACGGGAAGDQAAGKLKVVTSTDIWASVVGAVGGDRVAVEAIIDSSSADPHAYRATARDAADLLEADLALYNGGGYDPFMKQLLTETDTPAFTAVELSGSDGNEHIWYDPAAVARVADAVAHRLAELRPAAKRSFLDNAAAFKNKLGDVSAAIGRIAAEHGASTVLSTSPLAHYLLRAAKLDNVTPPEFTTAVEEGTDIPVLARQHVKKMLSTGKVDTVVRNSQTVTPAVDKLVETAARHRIPVVDVTETLPEGATGYVGWMSGQVKALGEALDHA